MKMFFAKKIILSFILCCLAMANVCAQEYSITSGGQGKNGRYLVRVTLKTKAKKSELNAENLLKHYAVHGVMFRGIASTEGFGEQKPLVCDPNLEQVKSDFFNAFFAEESYKRYASIVESSMSSTKLSKKTYEVTALLLVDKESLQNYLEKSGIIEGFSNLW